MTSKLAIWVGVGIACALVAVVAMWSLDLGIAELDFSGDPAAIASAVEKGWLPTWLPASAYDVRGAQRTFDASFIWITFRIRRGEEARFLDVNCSPASLEAVRMPASDYVDDFPAHVRESYDSLLAHAARAEYYACGDSARKYFVAASDSRSLFYLWAH